MVWLKRLVTALVLLVVLFLVVGLFLPRDVQVERSLHMDASPRQVFAVVSDFHQFNDWSPWYGLDPAARYDIAGEPGQSGHSLSWQSNKAEVGNGTMRLLEANAPGYVAMKLDFGNQEEADSYFRIKAEGSGSQVTWGFRTNFGNDVLGRYFGLLMDKILGDQYQQGLMKLKEKVEKSEPDDNG
ncbi:SRPBCC family protein [Gallaecimonas xiamenensis]|uniref:Polyketide cyclase/dehydrase n=1 Tax=Gallaecimonas xiamenensis 3-C-1 TaxID=745411 RepID=K2IZE0_9GAMM|nr:SRPBCC family protein [Gallaecimonas xiamenensis]EKE75901.1 hypothetical protein B3C1_05562 [Gallaecimonas xiamenensis 3-C-1]